MFVRSAFIFVSTVGLTLSACVLKPPAVSSPTTPASFIAPAKPGMARLIVTSSSTSFERSSIAADSVGAADVVVQTSNPLQTITGFGGAFNEQGWEALLVLPPSERDAVLKALFDPTEGLRFNSGRVPVGASDYALERYTLDESPGDYTMRNFSISRDQQRLIPYIQAALSHRPDLMLWASAWTPPTWMKTNGAFDGGAMKDDPETYAAYALYLARFVQSYGTLGVKIAMVVPQNEPGQVTHYPSCDWQPQQYASFIGEHLGPTFRRESISAAIFVGTINRAEWDVLSVLSNPKVQSQIAGVAVQWNALEQVAQIHRQYPTLPIMQSETECGNHHWEPGFNPEQPPNDFKYAMRTWRKFRDFIQAGSSSYMVWNMVLKEPGKNIDSQRPWPQNSPIVIHRDTNRVDYTSMYWATKHYSGLIDSGAKLLQTAGHYADSIAFVNPDGTRVVELLNSQTSAVQVMVGVDGHNYAVQLPPTSFATVMVPG